MIILIIPPLLNSTAPSDLRYSIELCDGEKAFLQKRKKIVLEAMKKCLGERGPKNLNEVGSSMLKPRYFYKAIKFKKLT